MQYFERLIHAPKGSFFLFGPRGTGKSTWLNRHCGDALQINLLEPDVCRRLLARPEHLAAAIAGAPERKTVLIDEVQRVPELLTVVHQLMEQRKDLRFVMTGSSARKLKRSGMDLLAGRAVVAFAHPFLAVELDTAFSLEKSLSLRGLWRIPFCSSQGTA